MNACRISAATRLRARAYTQHNTTKIDIRYTSSGLLPFIAQEIAKPGWFQRSGKEAISSGKEASSAEAGSAHEEDASSILPGNNSSDDLAKHPTSSNPTTAQSSLLQSTNGPDGPNSLSPRHTTHIDGAEDPATSPTPHSAHRNGVDGPTAAAAASIAGEGGGKERNVDSTRNQSTPPPLSRDGDARTEEPVQPSPPFHAGPLTKARRASSQPNSRSNTPITDDGASPSRSRSSLGTFPVLGGKRTEKTPIDLSFFLY